jgi:formylglycine-generating enzyme required for sulfatase activity
MRAPIFMVVSAAAAGVLAGCGFDVAGVNQLPRRPADDGNPPPVSQGVATRRILEGAFMMGCNDGVVADCEADEKPYHSVMLSPYEIDRTETSQAAYLACMNAHFCTKPVFAAIDPIDLGDFPVVGVTWIQAAQYCAFADKRLPTEAEWERAARGEDGRTWPWGNEAPTCTRANFGDCGEVLRATGGDSRGASPHGVVDMAGNALEWVADWYDDRGYASADATDVDPRGPRTGVARVLRGGSFTSDAHGVRTTQRSFEFPGWSFESVGFRCARSIEKIENPE